MSFFSTSWIEDIEYVRRDKKLESAAVPFVNILIRGQFWSWPFCQQNWYCKDLVLLDEYISYEWNKILTVVVFGHCPWFLTFAQIYWLALISTKFAAWCESKVQRFRFANSKREREHFCAAELELKSQFRCLSQNWFSALPWQVTLGSYSKCTYLEGKQLST